MKGEVHEKINMNQTTLSTITFGKRWDDILKNDLLTGILEPFSVLLKLPSQDQNQSKREFQSSLEIVDFNLNTTISAMNSYLGPDDNNFSLRDIVTYPPWNETEHVEDYNHICFYGSTRVFFREQATKSFVINLLTILHDLSLRSFNKAV
jgi:hypothetical protein